MARLARTSLPGYPHHLIQRGNNRQPIFADETDRTRYLELLRDAAREHGVAIHAYVLMGNHVHLLATPAGERSLSVTMHQLGTRYVGWYNHRHRRSGTLWEGRFRSGLIEAESWLLCCMRYIELNPVRAGLAPVAEEWRWSSARHHFGIANDPLVSDHAVFWSLGNTPFEREARYREFVQQSFPSEQTASLTAAALRGRAVGSGTFMDRVAKLTGVRQGGKRGRPPLVKPVPN